MNTDGRERESLTSPVAQTVKRLPTMWETAFDPWVGKILWRRKWPPTPVLLPGKSYGQRSLVGYSPWGCKESDMTEQLNFLSWSDSSYTGIYTWKNSMKWTLRICALSCIYVVCLNCKSRKDGEKKRKGERKRRREKGREGELYVLLWHDDVISRICCQVKNWNSDNIYDMTLLSKNGDREIPICIFIKK